MHIAVDLRNAVTNSDTNTQQIISKSKNIIMDTNSLFNINVRHLLNIIHTEIFKHIYIFSNSMIHQKSGSV